METLEYILQAAYLPKYRKNEHIKRASDKIDFLKYLIRLAHETKLLNTKKYFMLEEKTLEVGKMLGGWLKAT